MADQKKAPDEQAGAEASPFEKRLTAMQAAMPKDGTFNLVGMDDYEDPGDELYVIGNYPTKEAAQKALEDRKKENPDETLYVYGG